MKILKKFKFYLKHFMIYPLRSDKQFLKFQHLENHP